MSTTRQCAECGVTLPDDVPEGACPVCALRGALELPEDTSGAAVTEKAGDRIGRYKLLEKIGEGGYGIVYMAEQAEPIRRRVALKVVKLGMDTKQVIARFEAERQALALMDHPNIARVLDAGATDAGRPYFVMELVRGVRITDYCDQHKLSTKERLGLFIQVCHAVQHAHQKGIIHRDLKPSNVLVTRLDGAPVPKVIDFGIAKATQQPLTQKTLFTAFQQFIGTPAYMSPEQAEMSGADMDTRSDIYSLGVLLYELVTGHTPFENSQLKRMGFDELRQLIREQEPPRPSTRLRALAPEELTTVARRQQTEAPRLVHLVRGDLDWIVMKCLEKDRARRYETASGLVHDVQRHLNHEPVTAAGPSAVYRLRKFARRHRFGLATALIVSGIVIAGVVVGLAQAQRANEQAERANQEAARANQAEEMAKRAAQAAQERQHEAEGALEKVRAQQAVVEEALAQARREKAEKEQALEREQAQKANALASAESAQTERGKAQKAQKDAEAARDDATNATVRANLALAETRRQQVKLKDYMDFLLFKLSDELRTIGRVGLLRDVTTNVLAHYQSLPPEGESEESLSRRVRLFENLGRVLAIQGESTNAEVAFRKGLELAEKLAGGAPGTADWQEDVFICHQELGKILAARGDAAPALREFEAGLTIAQRLATNAPPDSQWQEHLVRSRLQVGDARRTLADRAGALAAYESALATALGLAGRDPTNAARQLDLSVCYGKVGGLLLEEKGADSARKRFERSYQIARQFADRHPANPEWQSILADACENLGDVDLAGKDGESALEHYQEAFAIRKRLAGNDSGDTRRQRDLLRSRFNIARAEAYERRGSKQLKAFLTTWQTLVNVTKMPLDVGNVLFAPGDKGSDPRELLQRHLDDARLLAAKDPGNVQWKEDLATYHTALGDMLLGARKTEDGLKEYRHALDIRQQLASRDTNAVSRRYRLALSHANAAVALRRLAKPGEALAEARQALDLVENMISRWPGNFALIEGPRANEGNIRRKLYIDPRQQDDFRAIFIEGFDAFKASLATDAKTPSRQAEWAGYCSERAVLALFYGNLAEAVDHAQKAVDIWRDLSPAAPAATDCGPRLMRAWLALGVLQLLDRQPQEAIKTARSALRFDSRRVEFQALLALGHLLEGQAESARRVMLENQGLAIGSRQTFSEAVLEDFHRLHDKRLTPPDMDRNETRLTAELPTASE